MWDCERLRGPREGSEHGGACIFGKQRCGGVIERLQKTARDVERRGEDEAIAQDVTVSAAANGVERDAQHPAGFGSERTLTYIGVQVQTFRWKFGNERGDECPAK